MNTSTGLWIPGSRKGALRNDDELFYGEKPLKPRPEQQNDA
jgi:hypothetical protein